MDSRVYAQTQGKYTSDNKAKGSASVPIPDPANRRFTVVVSLNYRSSFARVKETLHDA